MIEKRCCECRHWIGTKKVDAGPGYGKCTELDQMSGNSVPGDGIEIRPRFQSEGIPLYDIITDEDFYCAKFLESK